MNKIDGIKILVVDDHFVVRAGLRTLLTQLGVRDQNIEESSSLESLQAHVELFQPQLIFLDLMFRSGTSLTFIENLCVDQPKQNIVLYTQSDDILLLRKAIQAGVGSIISKADEFSVLIEQVRSVLQGGRVFPRWTRDLVSNKRNFSFREIQVAQLIAKGLTNMEIGQQLNCSAETIKTYRSSIIHKAGAKTSIEAILWMHNNGLFRVSS